MENNDLTPGPSPERKGEAIKKKSNPSSNRKGGFIWYPFLFAAYPVLGLLAHNIGQVSAESALRPLSLAVTAAELLALLFHLLLRDRYRAAFVASAWMGLFSAYGFVFLGLEDNAPNYAHTNVVAGAALLIAALALFAATRPKVRFEAWVAPLNVAALALVIFPAVQIASFEIGRATPSVRADAPIVAVEGTRPDIYYIVLDMYTRADTLKMAYGYNNSEFLGGLERTGFNVVECAMSNYVRTELSLSSSLNMTYLSSDLDPKINPESQARSPLWNLIRDNEAMAFVKARGYKTVAFATGFHWSELDNADVYLEPDPLRGGLTEFESLWLQTTAARILQDEGVVDPRVSSFEQYRVRTRFTLDTLPTLAEMDGPKFVFAHIILPHPPFVFTEAGGPADAVSFLNEKDQYPADKFEEGYTMQISFTNREIKRIVQEIIANSDTPPVIVIQGDHGPWIQPKDRRMTILNAYYLPGHEDAAGEFMTPVNTFRMIFNLYLGGDFELLRNVSYYSPVPNHFDFEPVSSKCNIR